MQNPTESVAGGELPTFGQLLRSTRGARRLSQLQLAVEADVSQRHLSFLESGRALPSREMVLQLARALDLPLRERNRLLVSAGFAGIHPTRALEATDMQPVRAALELLLAHHEPYPAIVVDRAWNLFMANAAVPRVFGAIGDLDAMFRRVCGARAPNVLEILFHPGGLQPYIRNFEEVAVPLLVRTAREALDHPHVQTVLDEVLHYPTVPARWRSLDLHRNANPLPVLPTEFAVGDRRLDVFSMMTTFGTPLDVTTDELRVESFFPADAASEALLRALASDSPGTTRGPPRAFRRS
ncbi:MAG: helix-turn-helix domain-containing protein [Myxococcota bacterium]